MKILEAKPMQEISPEELITNPVTTDKTEEIILEPPAKDLFDSQEQATDKRTQL